MRIVSKKLGWPTLCAALLLLSALTARAQSGSLDRIAFQFDEPAQGQGGGNPIVGSWHQVQQAYYQFQGNMFQRTDGVTAQRSRVPQAVTQPLPATWNLQPPPPINTGGGTSTAGGSSYNPPKYHVPGQGGTCDDAQVSQACYYGDGHTYRDRNTGCLVCQH